MQLIRSITCAVALIVATLAGTSAALAEAPKPAAPAKPAKDEIPAADAEKFLEFFNKFADAVIGNKDNCPKMASSINALIDRNAELIQKANEAKAAKKKLPKAIEEKMAARLKDMFAAMVKCKDDASVKAAMKRMDSHAANKSAPPAK